MTQPAARNKCRVSIMSIGGKVALITGASSGIGAATALLFSRLGAKLSLGDRQSIDDVANRCRNENKVTEIFALEGDLKKEDYVKSLVKSTVEHYGNLDILVNCAGILPFGTIEDTTLESFDEIMNINLRAVFHITSVAVPHLVKSEGCIVNVSSVNGIRAFTGCLAYNISKSGVDQLTRCVALELAPKKVRCNAVNPGSTVTPIWKSRETGLDDEALKQRLEHWKTTHALGRPGQPEEVANAIAFLASPEASFITGVSLPVDGGRHRMCPR